MATAQKISQVDFKIIAENNAKMIEAAQEGLSAFLTVPLSQRDDYVSGQIAYFRHIIAGFRWSTAIARSRIKGQVNVNGQ